MSGPGKEKSGPDGSLSFSLHEGNGFGVLVSAERGGGVGWGEIPGDKIHGLDQRARGVLRAHLADPSLGDALGCAGLEEIGASLDACVRLPSSMRAAIMTAALDIRLREVGRSLADHLAEYLQRAPAVRIPVLSPVLVEENLSADAFAASGVLSGERDIMLTWQMRSVSAGEDRAASVLSPGILSTMLRAIAMIDPALRVTLDARGHPFPSWLIRGPGGANCPARIFCPSLSGEDRLAMVQNWPAPTRIAVPWSGPDETLPRHDAFLRRLEYIVDPWLLGGPDRCLSVLQRIEREGLDVLITGIWEQKPSRALLCHLASILCPPLAAQPIFPLAPISGKGTELLVHHDAGLGEVPENPTPAAQ